MEGIIKNNTIKDFGRIYSKIISKEAYEKRKEAIKNNFDLVEKYRFPEKTWIWPSQKGFIKLLKEMNLV